MAKYKYAYRCPDCGTQLELKMRVTQTKRRCPQWGTPIVPSEIDRQQAESFLVGLVGFVSLVVGGFLFFATNQGWLGCGSFMVLGFIGTLGVQALMKRS